MDNQAKSEQSSATGAPDHHRRSHMDVPRAREPEQVDLERGYEATDVGLRVVIFSVLSLAISAAVIIAIGKWFNDELIDYVQAEQKEVSDDTRPHHLPPDPRLQPSVGHGSLDRQDMIALREEQEGKLNEKGEYEGGLATVGFKWDVLTGRPQVGAELEGRVSQWLRSPATRPTTAPSSPAPAAPAAAAPAPAAPAAPPESTQPSPAGPPATQSTTAPAAPSTTQPTAPTTPAGEAAPPTSGPTTLPTTSPAGEPAKDAAKPLDGAGSEKQEKTDKSEKSEKKEQEEK